MSVIQVRVARSLIEPDNNDTYRLLEPLPAGTVEISKPTWGHWGFDEAGRPYGSVYATVTPGGLEQQAHAIDILNRLRQIAGQPPAVLNYDQGKADGMRDAAIIAQPAGDGPHTYEEYLRIRSKMDAAYYSLTPSDYQRGYTEGADLVAEEARYSKGPERKDPE